MDNTKWTCFFLWRGTQEEEQTWANWEVSTIGVLDVRVPNNQLKRERKTDTVLEEDQEQPCLLTALLQGRENGS